MGIPVALGIHPIPCRCPHFRQQFWCWPPAESSSCSVWPRCDEDDEGDNGDDDDDDDDDDDFLKCLTRRLQTFLSPLDFYACTPSIRGLST